MAYPYPKEGAFRCYSIVLEQGTAYTETSEEVLQSHKTIFGGGVRCVHVRDIQLFTLKRANEIYCIVAVRCPNPVVHFLECGRAGVGKWSQIPGQHLGSRKLEFEEHAVTVRLIVPLCYLLAARFGALAQRSIWRYSFNPIRQAAKTCLPPFGRVHLKL